jgi:hypothetical protein
VTTYVWEGNTGFWSTSTNWSPVGIPNAASDVAVDVNTGTTCTITVDAGQSYLLNALVLGAAGSELNVQGTLRFAGSLDILALGAGTLSLASGGVVEGAIIQSNGGRLAASGGTLNGVSYEGTLDLSPNSSSMYIANGLTATGLNGTGPGVVNLTGNSDAIYFKGTQTFDNATVTLGGASGQDDALYQDDSGGAGNQVLTLGVSLIINADGAGATIGTASNTAGDRIVNQGTINAGGADGQLFENALNFMNQGTINVTNGASFYLGGYSGGSWSNAGTITVGAGAALHLDRGFTGADLGTITDDGGTIYIDGMLTNTGATLNVGLGASLSNVVLASDGTIAGGTIVDQGAGVVFSGGTLDSVAYDGILDLSPDSSSVYIAGGLLATGLNGKGPGLVTLTGNNGAINFEGTQTFDNATVTLGGAAGQDDALYQDDSVGAGNQVLTLGAGLVINADGEGATIGTASNTTGDRIVNQGTINAGGADGQLFENALNFMNQGTINVTNGASFYLGGYSGGSWSNAGTITVAAGAALHLDRGFTGADLGTITDNGGTIYIDGTLTNTGATLNLGVGASLPNAVLASDGTIVGGTIVDQGARVVFSGGTLNGVRYDGTLDLSPNASNVYIANGLTATELNGTAPGLVNLTGKNGAINFEGTQTFDNATVTLGGAAGQDDALYQEDSVGAGYQVLTLGTNLVINVGGTGAYIGTASNNTGDGIVNQGTINAGGTNGRLFENALNFTNQGTINVTNGSLSVKGSSFSNEGKIAISNGGYADLGSTTLTSTGTLLLGNGGTLEIASPTSAKITYNGPATLILDNPYGYTGTLAGLAAGDTLQLDGQSISSATISGTKLTANLGSGAGIITYNINPGLDTGKLSISQGSDGYQDLLSITCFLAGTHILTEHGEVPVETLREGDLVVTRGGDGASLASVRWIGWRRIDVATHPRPTHAWPIRIRRDAVAPGQPCRDLLVSPDHAVFFDGLLVPARLLVNGMSIVQEDRFRRVEYFHVELDRHAILVSEGLQTESYLDTGNRAIFENAGLALVLHPEFTIGARMQSWSRHACAPLAVGAAEVEPVWHRLAGRAGAMGLTVKQVETTTEPNLYLDVGGLAIRAVAPPQRDAEAGYVFVLPPGATAALLCSRATSPAEIEPFQEDRRRLGVAVHRLRIYGPDGLQEIPVDAPTLCNGWWAAEQTPGALWRWTNGAARIPLPARATMIEVVLRGTHRYATEPTGRRKVA